MNIRKTLVAISIMCHGKWDEIYQTLLEKEFPDDAKIDEICSDITCKVTTILDSDYPGYLKECFRPPFVLFYYGDLSLINDFTKNIAVVGTRLPTSKGLENTNNIVSALAKRMNVVSGLAKGIDRQAHESAINAGGKTIAVLGCGIDLCYPSCNEDIYKEIKQNHLLISEYYNVEPPSQDHFPHRNRLISILSGSTLVPEASTRSGTSITVAFSTSFNRTIFAIPSSNLEDSLCNNLIRDGAVLVRNADDIFYELMM